MYVVILHRLLPGIIQYLTRFIVTQPPIEAYLARFFGKDVGFAWFYSFAAFLRFKKRQTWQCLSVNSTQFTQEPRNVSREIGRLSLIM
jgi:hypothetical protein